MLNNSAKAIVQSGVVMDANDVVVDSDIEGFGVSTAISAGKTKKVAIQGAVTLLEMDNCSVAQIDDGAEVEVLDFVLECKI